MLTSVSIQVRHGDICGIIGPNGSGKTSLLNCVNRFYRPDRGGIVFDGIDITRLPSHEVANLGVGRTFQNIKLFPSLSVIDTIRLGRHTLMRAGLVSGLIYYGRAKREESVADAAIESEVLIPLRLTHLRDEPVRTLPYALQKRVEFGRALAMRPKLLLLDEPTAGMDPDETSEMIELILCVRRQFGITMLLIEHDMRVVAAACDRVWALEFGTVIAEGSPEEVQMNETVIRSYLGDR